MLSWPSLAIYSTPEVERHMCNAIQAGWSPFGWRAQSLLRLLRLAFPSANT